MGFKRNWVAFFLLGTINNLSYVVVNSAAMTISTQFHKQNLIGLIPYANIALGFAVRLLNAFYLQHTSYGVRMFVNAIFMAAALVGLAFAPNFWLALVAIVVIGACSSFGESVVLGYLKFYPSKLLNGWSSGTGVAGVGGAALYLLYAAANLSLMWSFLLTVPCLCLYLLSIHLIITRGRPIHIRLLLPSRPVIRDEQRRGNRRSSIARGMYATLSVDIFLS